MSEPKWDTEANRIAKAAAEATPTGLRRAAELLNHINPVDAATAETAELVICSKENYYIIGQTKEPCVDCGVMVYVGPSSPKKPPKICCECFTVRLEKEDQ